MKDRSARLVKATSFENEFKQPGSVIFLGTVACGFAIYGISAISLIMYDIVLKIFWNKSCFMGNP